ncbi:MAG: toll/interleukin-1 receptor domain-containing protein [Oscillospiraceae bacterium]|jgi:ACT domain-containing protein|nr:toll/interleukin-1 receptor domain-containing protein [Oscillospiraceae bacterium]
MAHDVFISYNSNDKQLADALCHAVENEGIKCWIAPRDVTGGIAFAEEIINAIDKCGLLVLIASANVKNSHHVLNEIHAAVDKSKIIIPFKTDDDDLTDAYHYYIGKTHWIEAFPNPQEAFSELIVTIAHLLEKNISDTVLENSINKVKIADKNKVDLIKNTYEERLSFGLSIADEKNIETTDQIHYYDFIKRIDFIDSKEGQTYQSYRWLTITNTSGEPSKYIVHKECGENKVRFEAMNVKAFIENRSGEKLQVESITSIQPNFEQIFKIHFKKPLMPDEQIKILYRIDWPSEPNSYSTNSVANSISFTRYKKGVGGVLFANLEKDLEITGIEFYGITSDFENKTLNIPYENFDIKTEADLQHLDGKGFTGFYFKCMDSNYLAYRILYKTVDESNKDDDYF